MTLPSHLPPPAPAPGMTFDLRYALGPQGAYAVRMPAFLYTRYHGEGVVSFIGASRVAEPNPLRFGSQRDVVFVNGAVIVAPAHAIATDAFHGETLGNLVTGYHDAERMLTNGETIIDLGA